jgi:hypothetical protein
MPHLIVGAGGVASWLVPLLKHTLPADIKITLVDGDQLEIRNLDRQFFGMEYIGWNKAEALAHMYGLDYDPAYLSRDSRLVLNQEEVWSTIWCCADNHPARKLVLELVDEDKAPLAIIGGNEYTDSEAYAYTSERKGTASDPRIFYPELSEDQTGDPLNPYACQGVAQIGHPQLALANYLAAGMMVHLWWFIAHHGHEVSMDNWPKVHQSNFAMFNTRHL